MFRKLLLKLTLLNAGVIAILFLTLITGAYFYAQHEINRHSVSFLTRAANEINAGITPPFISMPPAEPKQFSGSVQPEKRPMPPPPVLPGLPGGPPSPPPDDFGPRMVVFFVQTDSEGKIVFSSAQKQLNADQLKSLVASVRGQASPNGRIDFANTLYFFLAVPRHDQPGTLYLFQDFEREYSVFQTIMEALAVIGFLCFIASLFGSLFLAGRAMRPIRLAWSKQRDFLADASHELRTPLAVIQASLDVIRSNTDEQVSEQRQWLDNIGESVESMASLVESLLFLARIDSQQHPIDKKTFALDKAIANVVELFKPMTEEKSIRISVECEPGISVLGDEARIKQVLGILLDNAIRHTPPEGKISVMLQQIQHSIQLTVTDTGEGISSENLPKIFDRFYQVDPSRNKGGAGLGLAIAKCIVETHAGTIQAQSKPDNGTTFLIRIPLR